ncbi:hypothetical protein [Anaerotruncus rubiinfantis]|uniref:hypothetical protein n=1 Tax=Anaerotruncus rubiinfantis TaxID=1720200 RepID=UPI0034A2FA92
MKKVLALVLALATVLSMSVVAFADAEQDFKDGKDIGNIKVTTIYNDKGTAIADLDKVQAPDSKYYIGLDISEFGIDKNELGDIIDEGKLLKLKTSKGDDNTKIIESVKLIEKKLDNRARQWYIEVKVKDDMTDKEYKISPEFNLQVKKDLIVDGGTLREIKSGETATFKAGGEVNYIASLWIGNTTDTTDDSDETAGTGGKMIKPVKNEENTVTWEDENDNLATLTFDADSSVVKYFPKLSTKWDNVKYAELFADQDAFVRQWVGTPSISSTSRATLELNVPYIDEDDELTVDEDSIIVYEETADGELVDITAKGKFDWNDDDEFVFTMKTRSLGTYIFAEAPVTEADADDEVPADEVVDADKVNPGTGF